VHGGRHRRRLCLDRNAGGADSLEKSQAGRRRPDGGDVTMANDEVLQLVRKGPLFSLACRFIAAPATYVEWGRDLPGIEKPRLDAMIASRRGRRSLSRWVIRREQWTPVDFRCFNDPPCRLALLEPAALRRLLTLAGAATASRDIAAVIDHAVVKAVKDALGEDVYLFALKRVPMLLGDLEADWATPADVADWGLRVRAAGCRCLEQCLAAAPASVASRVAIKLGGDWPFDAACRTSTHRDAAWRILKRILFSDVGSELSSYFA
jgi:hypothetical protein